ncbi:MAG: EpsI family protein [Proteobacteria bacterium]|nr:EpsI family protein [Pseudomonadota bacterium]
MFNQAGEATIPININNIIPVNRAFMEKSAFRQLTYYWFPQRGRIPTNAYLMPLPKSAQGYFG